MKIRGPLTAEAPAAAGVAWSYSNGLDNSDVVGNVVRPLVANTSSGLHKRGGKQAME